MVMGYWSVAILFWQLSIDHIVNVQCKRCGFTKTRLRHPSLPFDSLPYPTRTICRRVRTYARSVTWQPNEKRLTIFYEYGAQSHARFARAGAPLLPGPKTKESEIKSLVKIQQYTTYMERSCALGCGHIIPDNCKRLHVSNMCLSTLVIGEEQPLFITEITPAQPFFCVNRSPIRYDFRGGARARSDMVRT